MHRAPWTTSNDQLGQPAHFGLWQPPQAAFPLQLASCIQTALGMPGVKIGCCRYPLPAVLQQRTRASLSRCRQVEALLQHQAPLRPPWLKQSAQAGQVKYDLWWQTHGNVENHVINAAIIIGILGKEKS